MCQNSCAVKSQIRIGCFLAVGISRFKEAAKLADEIIAGAGTVILIQ
jgi:hypothetical protein